VYLDLNFELTEEQVALKQAVHKFAENVLRPAGKALDAMPPEEVVKSEIYWNAVRQTKELNYHTVFIPEIYGGMGLSPLELNIFLEELGWGSAGLAISIAVDVFPAMFASMLGTDYLVDEVILPFVRSTDGSVQGCWPITEPDHGSDTLMVGTPFFNDPRVKMSLTAKKDGDDWILNGQKAAWVSNGPTASHGLVFLGIDGSQGMDGGGVAIIPLNLPGISRGKPLNKLGQRDLPQGEIFFDNVRLPGECMVAEPEIFTPMLDTVLATANAAMSAMFNGVARAAFEEALKYCRTRVQGGRPLVDHQQVQLKLFDMFHKIEAARALSRAAMNYNYSNTPPVTRYSIAAKVFSTNVAFEVADDAIQLLGGNGLSREYLTEKLMRDARASRIEDGSNEVLGLTAAYSFIAEYEC